MIADANRTSLMESDFHLHSRYFGVQSARYPATAVLETQVAVPLGGEVHIRDLSTLSLTHRFKVADDTVMVLLPLNDHLLCMSYSGVVALYTASGVKLAQTSTSQRTVRHGAVSKDGRYVCACGEFGPANGTVDVWEIVGGEFQPVRKLVGNYRFCEFSNRNQLFVMRESVLERDESSVYRKDQPISAADATVDFPEEVQADPIDIEALRASRRENRKNTYFACLFDLDSNGRKDAVALPTVSYIICCKSNAEGLVALMYLSRTLVVLRKETLEVVQSVELQGAGAIIAFTFTDNYVYFSPANRVVTRLAVLEQYAGPVNVMESSHAGVVVTKTNFECLTKGLYFLQWVDRERRLVVCEETGLFLCALPQYPAATDSSCVSQTGHNTTCCGVALNRAGTLLCSGDFSGQVFVWALESQLLEPVAKYNVVRNRQFVPVRCMAMDPEDRILLVGTMMGSVYMLERPGESTSDPAEIISGEHAVVCMSWKGTRLALGSVSGELKIYDFATGSAQLLQSFLAHEPSTQPKDPKFGSLTLFSEIWTLSWSPRDEDLIATGSEDQTVVVWELAERRKVVTLPKHRNAVTGVVWKVMERMSVGGHTVEEILASCSDDQQLRIYDPQTWTLLHTFRTTFICEWHTLTYLALEEQGTRAAVVSQNGYLFIYDIAAQRCLFGEKVHSGSVEGLTWTGQYCATVSSDCSVSAIRTDRSVGGKALARI